MNVSSFRKIDKKIHHSKIVRGRQKPQKLSANA
jgi:hypothetical protein